MTRTIFKIALPVFLELALQMAIQLVDTLMLARVSDAAAGTVGMLAPFFGLVMMVFVSLSQAGNIKISHALGAAKTGRAERYRFVTLAAATLLALATGLIVHLFGDPLLGRLYSFTPDQRQYAGLYLSIAAWSVMTQSLAITIGGFVRSAGKPHWTLPGSILGNLVNAWMAYHLVTTGYGVSGVAISAICGQLVMILWNTGAALSILKLRISPPKSIRLMAHYLSSLQRLFVPIVVEPIAFQTAQVLIGVIVTRLGTEAMAARSYAGTFYAFCFLWSISMGQTAQYLVSLELGKKRAHEASASLFLCLKFAIVGGSAVALAMALAGPRLLTFVTSSSSIIEKASLLFWIAFLGEWGRVCNIVVGAALKAANDARYPARIGIVFMLGMSVPLAAILGLSLNLGIVGVGFALAADEVVRGLLNLRRWTKRAWSDTSLCSNRSHAATPQRRALT
jgi:putative MATE family efflux protein